MIDCDAPRRPPFSGARYIHACMRVGLFCVLPTGQTAWVAVRV